jgi:outer membrane receptor for ferrienterochelin and colicins
MMHDLMVTLRSARWLILPALLAGFLVPTLASADESLLRGVVVDAGSGRRMVGANIQVLGTVLGTISDVQGEFVVARVPAGPYRIRISRIGYSEKLVDVELPSTEIVRIEMNQSTISLNPVIVTADRRPRPLDESSMSVTVLGEAEISARTNLRLDEALEMIPGVYFMEDDINIRGATGYRANTGNRVLLLLDGVPLITSDTGGINWDIIPLHEVERVEVVKGAGSALWGSGAIGGVVNVITKRPSQQGLLSIRSTAGVYDEPSAAEWDWTDRTLHYERVDIGYSKAFGPTGLRVAASRYASTGDRQDGDFNKWTVSGKINRHFADASELEFYVAWLRDHSGVFVQWRSPFLPDSTDTTPAQLFHPLLSQDQGNVLKVTWLNTYLKYSRSLSARSHLRVRASLLRSMLGNQFDRAGAFSPAHGPGLEIQLDWLPRETHFISAGVDGKVHFVDGRFFDGSHTELALATFVQDEWRLRHNLRLTTGLRFDQHGLDGDGPYRQTSPRIGINFRPTSTLSLRASAGRAFRVPTTAERSMSFKTGNFRVISSDYLKPERAWSYEAGARQTVGGHSYVDAAVFQNDYRDFVEPLVDLAQTASLIVVRFQNVNDARIRGVELGAGTRLWHQRLRLDGGLTLLDSEDLELERPLAYRPRWTVQLSPSVHLGRVSSSLNYRYSSRLQQVSVYSGDERVPQHELNVRAQIHWSGLSWTVGVNNLFNYNYTQLERNLGDIRNFAIGINGTF